MPVTAPPLIVAQLKVRRHHARFVLVHQHLVRLGLQTHHSQTSNDSGRGCPLHRVALRAFVRLVRMARAKHVHAAPS